MNEQCSSSRTWIGLDEKTIGLEYSYLRLKDQLIRRLAVSVEAKWNHLLNEQRLGQLLREMRHLGGDKVGSELLKFLWLQRLQKST